MLLALQPGARASADGGVAVAGADAGPPARDQSSADPTWYHDHSGEAPRLVERRDGSYEYKGRGFDAVIEPNGNLRMRDRVVRTRFIDQPTALRDDKWATWTTYVFEFRYDLAGWLMKMFGRTDPFRSERRWFMEGTRELRERLASQSLASEMRKALHAIWSKAGITFEERRQRTFALWDESAEDEFGQIARTEVESFVREHCPEGSPLGFSGEALRALNQTRRSRALFAPYRPRDAGGQ